MIVLERETDGKKKSRIKIQPLSLIALCQNPSPDDYRKEDSMQGKGTLLKVLMIAQ
jgi:hypothetical protein